VNDQERRRAVQSALADLTVDGVGRYIAVQKLKAVLDDWGEPNAELKRLIDFETKTRQVLGLPYSIRKASFNKNGKPCIVRILDEDDVLDLLGLQVKKRITGWSWLKSLWRRWRGRND
jgi:hypothetical protein